jgi:hypothetical protein
MTRMLSPRKTGYFAGLAGLGAALFVPPRPARTRGCSHATTTCLVVNGTMVALLMVLVGPAVAPAPQPRLEC